MDEMTADELKQQEAADDLETIYKNVRKRVSDKKKPRTQFLYIYKHWNALSPEEQREAAELAEVLDLKRDIPSDE